jgi:hypothetical protein
MDLTYFYPTRTRKTINKLERYCSGSRLYYLKKHVINEKDGWYHVMECIGRRSTQLTGYTQSTQVRDIFRHYIIPHYDYMNDNAVSRLSGLAARYDPDINVTKLDKKYHVQPFLKRL